MDSITDPQIEKVVFCSAAQIGKTEGCVLNVIGYFCDQDPSPILIVLPAEKHDLPEEFDSPSVPPPNAIKGSVQKLNDDFSEEISEERLKAEFEKSNK